MRRARLAGLLCLALLAVLPVGCSRQYWRRNADSEAYGLIREKTKLDARWAQPRTDIIPPPLSRNFDPADPDYGALPPDDPAAHRYMVRMSDCDRIRGSKYYDELGMSRTIENPAWVASLPPDPVEELLESESAEKLTERPSVVADLTENGLKKPWNSLVSKFKPTAPGRATVATADVAPSKLTAKPKAASKTTSQASPAKAPEAAKVSAVAKATVPGKGAAAVPVPKRPRKPESGILLTSFQEEPAEPDAEPLPPAPFPPGEDDLDVPPTPGGRPPSATLPDADDELSDDPGDADAAATAPAAEVDLTAGNPALPEVEGVTLEEAVRLSYLHSREYQAQIEEVFLAALDLAFDRFQFDVRFLGIGGRRPGGDLTYTGVPEGQESLGLNSRVGISRLLPAGGQWAVELANQTLWLFSDAPDESTTASTLSFSFIQPLLFAAGRKVVLEDLTQSERNLLYAARDLARFRQTFFVSTVSGGQSGGYLGLLEQIQTIANQEDNIRRLREQLEVSRANVITADPLSLSNLESQYLQQLNNLRNSRAQLQDRLDTFKIQLGLPPDLTMALDTKLLGPFRLISPELAELEEAIDDEYYAVAGDIRFEDPRPEDLRQAIEALRPIVARIREVAFPSVERDFERVREVLPKRLANLPDPANDRVRVLSDLERDRDLYDQARTQFEEQVTRLDQLAADLEAAETIEQRQAVYLGAGEVEEVLERGVRGLQGIQAGLRTELIELNPFDLPLTESVGYALTNRVDLMNEQALVTDARRRVEVASNALRAVLDVRVEGDVRTRPLFQNDNPLDFRRQNSTYRVGLGFTAPLDQIAQRNAYRVSQVNYQRTRRAYIAAEDQVKQQVRTNWRQLEVLRQNFENARYSIRVAARQYDLAVEQATGPQRGGAGGAGGGGGGGGGAGNQGTQLLQALNRLLQAQNQLIGFWVDYESARLNIYRDMGIMEVDARGLWCDPFYQNGLTWPEGAVGMLPGQGGATDGAEDGSDDSTDSDVIPPAPAPSDGVEQEEDGPAVGSPSNSAASRPASPAKSVRPAAHTSPPASPSRKVGHVRARPSVSPGGKSSRPSDRAAAGSGTKGDAAPGWRRTGQGGQAKPG